jgi:hypothetical protein
VPRAVNNLNLCRIHPVSISVPIEEFESIGTSTILLLAGIQMLFVV